MKLRFYVEEKVVILEDSKDFEIINFSVDRKVSFFYQLKNSKNWNEIIIDFNDDKSMFEVEGKEYNDKEYFVFCADSTFNRFFVIAVNDIYIMEE